MITRASGAFLRAILSALVLMFPSLMLPSVPADTAQIVVILALLAGALIFVEYNSRCPSIIEFRFAPPFNRLRFGFMAVAVLWMAIVARGQSDPGAWAVLLSNIGTEVGHAMDFPYSPVRLVLVLLPQGTDVQTVDLLRLCAGVCYALSFLMLAIFVLMVQVLGWPVRRGAFNVWLNLPLFDPTGGGDVVDRLQREAAINFMLGFLLPFLLPAAVLVAARSFDHLQMLSGQTLIWVTCAWAFLPAGMIMRAFATYRVAGLISQKRRRAYARAEAEGADGLQAV